MSNTKQIITGISSRQEFLNLLPNNPGIIVLKFGAEWCGPCKKIEPTVHDFFTSTSDKVLGCLIDVDECFDLFAFLKSKKMVNGSIPVILCYKKGNNTYIPDDSVNSSDPNEVKMFFIRCMELLKTTY